MIGRMAFAVCLIWLALAFSLIITLLGSPVMLVLAGSCVALALIAASSGVTASRMKIADKSARNLSILALGIGVGILLQVAPLNLIGFNRPLWSAVAAAIGESTAGYITAGYITVDRGETIITLAKYLVLVGTVVTVSLACADQRRSTQMLYGLAWLLSIFAGACLLKILLNVVSDFDGKARLLADWTHVSVLGILLVGAMVIRKIPIGQFRLNALVPRAWPELSRGFVSGILIIALFSVPLFARGSQAYAIPVVCGI
jgi:hypothetical protein